IVVKTGDLQIIDAVASTVRVWKSKNSTKVKSLTARIKKISKDNIKNISAYPGMFALSLDDDRDGKFVNKALKSAKTLTALSSIAAMSGTQLKTTQLSKVIERVVEEGDSEAGDVIGGILRNKPRFIQELYKNRDYTNYLNAVKLTPELESGSAAEKRLNKVLSRTGGVIIKKVFDWDISIIDIPILSVHINHCQSSGVCSSGDPSYATGFQKGDALYRDLDISLSANHWHGGLFYKFTADEGIGSLKILHVSKGTGTGSNLVKQITATGDFSSPNISFSSTMSNLREKLIYKFCNSNNSLKFRAIKTVPNITRAQRNSVISVAATLQSYGFSYTWADMMDYKGWGWSGAYSDIDEMRCDGLIEFAYEKNSLRVCKGDDSSEWNITRSGAKYPENHNDFHNFSLNDGELCPKVQSGEEGTNSRFITPVEEVPVIDMFKVCCSLNGAVQIQFMASARMSDVVYARIRVRKRSQSGFRIIKSLPPGKVAVWKTVSVNSGQVINVIWYGERVGASSFKGIDGEYEFTLQVIDEGGNVSQEICRSIDVHW
ncbi:MAG: hypothetical protein OQK78_05830, partial [Gammaproteobacteria bacterium]|nr:hypothetical protein [Gammaproteobacteria bacterium]